MGLCGSRREEPSGLGNLFQNSIMSVKEVKKKKRCVSSKHGFGNRARHHHAYMRRTASGTRI